MFAAKRLGATDKTQGSGASFVPSVTEEKPLFSIPVYQISLPQGFSISIVLRIRGPSILRIGSLLLCINFSIKSNLGDKIENLAHRAGLDDVTVKYVWLSRRK